MPYYSGYPSGLYILANYLLENGIGLNNPPKLIVTGAETVLPHQRELIEKAFDSKLTDQYGASEQCANISECEHQSYHIDMEFGAVELLPIKGIPSKQRQIICTGFHNYAMPLIRYNIGDIATICENKCACGRQSPTIEKIDGRIESYILTPDGRQLGRLDFLFKDSHDIKEAQLFQENIDSVIVKIVREKTFNSKSELEFLKLLRQYLGDIIKVQFEYLDEIPRHANGKFRQIVSRVFASQNNNYDSQ